MPACRAGEERPPGHPTSRRRASNVIDTIKVKKARWSLLACTRATSTTPRPATSHSGSLALHISPWTRRERRTTRSSGRRAARAQAPSGVRTIARGWSYVEVQWLQPAAQRADGAHLAQDHHHGDPAAEGGAARRGAPTGYIMSAAHYQRLLDAVKP